MCSEGVSVWFACKLCKSFFLNADDFAYHKKKSHVQQFRNTKFIVFEEQTSPPVSPPENWISFLSSKKETRIHKIISSSSLPPTQINVDSNPNNEKLQSTRNEESIEIDPETNSDLNDRHNKSDDTGKEFNNCIDLNRDFNSNAGTNKSVDTRKNHRSQRNIAPTSTDNYLTNKQKKTHSASALKSATKHSKTSRPKIKTSVSMSLPSNILQTVIQSPHNPYIYLERLNLRTVQNASSHSNGTVQSHKNDRNHGNSNADVANEPNVTHGDQEKFSKSNSAISSPPLATLETCKCCSSHFNSTAKLIVHEEICCLKRQFEKIICVPCIITFGSSDALNAHNQHFHSNSGSASGVTKHRTEVADDLEAVPKTKIESGICLANDDQNQSLINNLPVSKHYDNNSYNDNDDWEEGVTEEASENTGLFSTKSILPDVFSSNQNQEINIPDKQNVMPGPSTEAHLSHADLLEVLKTEYSLDNEVSEFPVVDHDPLETESHMKSLAEETLNEAAASSSNKRNGNLEKKLAVQIQLKSSRYCASCQKMFISIHVLKNHFRNYHKMQGGKGNFTCPLPNCGKTVTTQSILKVHLRQSHSNARPFKCSHPNCKMSFKTQYNRKRHLKQVHLIASNDTATNQAPPIDFSRYCISCKKSFTNILGLKEHNRAYHVTQEPKPSLKCPQSKCTYTAGSRGRLNCHVKQVHSNIRPFKCSHPNCKMSFKTISIRKRHLKCHTKPHVKKVKCDFIL